MAQLRQIFRLMLAAAIALWLSHTLQWSESYWIIIAALLSLQMSSAPLLRQKQLILIVTAVLTAVAASITNYISPHVVLLAIFLFFSTLTTVMIGLRWPLYWSAAFLINFFAAVSSGFPTDMDGINKRFLSILMGFGIAIVLQKCFFPSRVRDDFRRALTLALQDLIDLNQAVFNCFLAVNYPEKQFEYAKKIHQERRDFSYAISVARELLEKIKGNKDKPATILCAIEELYEIIQALGTLLYRVDDHSTFQIAYKELLALSETISKDLRAIKLFLLEKTKTAPPQDVLNDNIFQLEDVNHAALNVAAKEPVVFLLFIQDLYALQKGMLQLTEAISAAVPR
jgi:uncharacterized membrane protein YccC